MNQTRVVKRWWLPLLLQHGEGYFYGLDAMAV